MNNRKDKKISLANIFYRIKKDIEFAENINKEIYNLEKETHSLTSNQEIQDFVNHKIQPLINKAKQVLNSFQLKNKTKKSLRTREDSHTFEEVSHLSIFHEDKQKYLTNGIEQLEKIKESLQNRLASSSENQP